METTIELSLKDLRIILKHAEIAISSIESSINARQMYGRDFAKLHTDSIIKYKEELETMYAYRIYLYGEIEKAKLKS